MKTIIAGITTIIISIIAITVFFYQDEQLETWISQYDEISGEAQLRETMKKSPKTYLLKDMVVTGEECDDFLGILDKPFIYIDYRKMVYERMGGRYQHDNKWYIDSETERKAEKLIVFNDIEFECEDFTGFCRAIPLDRYIKPEFADKTIDPDGLDYVYYPVQPGNFLDNVRYEIRGIPLNSAIACIAEVGDGHVRLLSYKEGEPPAIAENNNLGDLQYSLDETNAGIAAFGIFMLIAGICITVFGMITKK